MEVRTIMKNIQPKREFAGTEGFDKVCATHTNAITKTEQRNS